jgi:hypothetical protein
MRSKLRLAPVLAVVVASALPGAAAAQARPSVGVGVSVVPLEVGGNAPTVEIYLPLLVGPTIRLEPSFGVRTVNRPSRANNVDERDLTLGLGVFLMQKVAEPMDIYAGGRVKLNFARVEESGGGASDSGTDFIVAAALGGEHYLFSRFSVGLEAQLGYYSASSAASGGEATGFFTTGLALLRLYF